MHTQAPYYLDEERQWAIDSQELKSSVERARKSCNPRVMVVINPGNPTGTVSVYNVRTHACMHAHTVSWLQS